MISEDHFTKLDLTKIRREPRGWREILLKRRTPTTPELLIAAVLLATVYIYVVYSFAMVWIDYGVPA